jgi:hypothetical protein
MTPGTKAVTHFRATFEKVLHICTGAPAPKIKKVKLYLVFYLKKGKKEKKFHVEQSWLNENGSHLEVGRRKKTK